MNIILCDVRIYIYLVLIHHISITIVHSIQFHPPHHHFHVIDHHACMDELCIIYIYMPVLGKSSQIKHALNNYFQTLYTKCTACRELNINPTTNGLAGKTTKEWETTSENTKCTEHVNDVVTDWSYALPGFLVSTLFGVSPGQS